MALSLKTVAVLLPWRRKPSHADELYGSIVAQARLPVFYQGFGVPDTLEGRFVVLSLHLFAVLHRLKDEGGAAASMAQELADHFTADMETVLRELGVGDLAIPKKVRGLAASGAALLQGYAEALSRGEGALATSIAYALPLDNASAKLASTRLAPYLMKVIRHLEAQLVADLCAGALTLPEPCAEGRAGRQDKTMNQDADALPLSRTLRIADLEEKAEHRIEATLAERADIARRLELVRLDSLTFDYRLRRGAGGRIHLSGQLKALVVQTCVVSLEPVEAVIDVPVEAEFWPAPLIEELEEKAGDPGQSGLLEWPDAITDGMIDLGPVVYETLATSLDPYPKRPGASFEWSQGESEGEAPESGPFAALAKLKKR
jgi:uncharacterized metal-binding protein YceD (DUF177 family)